MRPKPIFTIGLPSTLGGSSISKEAIDSISKMISEKFQDYNVLTYTQETTSDPVFQAFYPKDFDEVAFQELKSQVLNLVNS